MENFLNLNTNNKNSKSHLTCCFYKKHACTPLPCKIRTCMNLVCATFFCKEHQYNRATYQLFKYATSVHFLYAQLDAFNAYNALVREDMNFSDGDMAIYYNSIHKIKDACKKHSLRIDLYSTGVKYEYFLTNLIYTISVSPDNLIPYNNLMMQGEEGEAPNDYYDNLSDDDSIMDP